MSEILLCALALALPIAAIWAYPARTSRREKACAGLAEPAGVAGWGTPQAFAGAAGAAEKN